jgi:spermidine/putrescine transport system substrate-binding protein
MKANAKLVGEIVASWGRRWVRASGHPGWRRRIVTAGLAKENPALDFSIPGGAVLWSQSLAMFRIGRTRTWR